MTTDPDMARDDDTTGWGWEDGWYIFPPRSDHPRYMSQYDAGYNARCLEDARMAEPSAQPPDPDPMDPRCYGHATLPDDQYVGLGGTACHEDQHLGTFTGRRKLERSLYEEF